MSSWHEPAAGPEHPALAHVVPISRDHEFLAVRALERAGALDLAPMLGLEVPA